MSISELRFIKRLDEFCPNTKESIDKIPAKTRGLYALLNKQGEDFEVVYIGMARGTKAGIRSRLLSHKKSKRKSDLWTHFSVYEVWDNITEAEIAELEGLFRHIYRKDAKANRINTQRSFKKLSRAKKKLADWSPKVSPEE